MQDVTLASTEDVSQHGLPNAQVWKEPRHASKQADGKVGV
jgi:hypothetical protein